MVGKSLFLMIIIIGVTWAQFDDDTVAEPATISPEIRDKISGIDKPKMCTTNQEGFNNFSNCLQSLVNMTQLKQEIEEAKPTGAVNEVFSKYCNKAPEFEQCLLNMHDASKPCLPANEVNQSYETVKNVSKQINDFVCAKNGSRIALLIAEGGPNCFMEQRTEIMKCFNSTSGINITLGADPITLVLVPNLSFNEASCQNTSALQQCMVNQLRNCKSSTTSEMVESLFEYVRKATPCASTKEPNAATRVELTLATILAVATSIMVFNGF